MQLTTEQIERIKSFKNRLAEVETSSLETTLNNFAEEHEPDKEISVWESIADRYEELLSKINQPDLTQKTEFFKKALMESLTNPETPVVLQKL
ncbi:hypothetical protein KAZ57_03070 [Patescibacteria group bacterium]|nr:hypothetical protein [Patescibacteria group bacterium]